MPLNQYLPIANSSTANALTPAQWAALSALLQQGFSSGEVLSQQFNTFLRQFSVPVSGLSQFIADNQTADVLDDGSVANFETKLTAALHSLILALIAANAIVPTPGTSTQKAPKLIGVTASSQGQGFSTSINVQMSLSVDRSNLYGTSTFISNTLTIGAGEAGIWVFTGFVQFQSGSAELGFTSVALRQNGNQVAIGGDNCGSGLSSYNGFSEPIVAAVGDVFTWYGYQQSGATLGAPNQSASAFLISSY